MIREYINREKIIEYGARPHPIVDVKDHLLRELDQAAENKN
jgi:hypothetical protein